MYSTYFQYVQQTTLHHYNNRLVLLFGYNHNQTDNIFFIEVSSHWIRDRETIVVDTKVTISKKM